MNPEELLRKIMDEFFSGISFEDIQKLTDENRFEFIMMQVDRLLTPAKSGALMTHSAADLASMFWHYNLQEMYVETVKHIMPLNDWEVLDSLSLEMRKVADFVRETALHCFYMLNGMLLELNVEYDDDYVYGDESEKAAFEYIKSTENKILAAYAAYGLLRHVQKTINHYEDFSPIIDFLAKPKIMDTGRYIEKPLMEDVSPKDYVDTIVDVLQKLIDHIREGHRLGMDDKEITIHDALCGRFMTEYIPQVRRVCTHLCNYLDMHVLLEDKSIYGTKEGQTLVRQRVEEFINYVRTVRGRIDSSVWKPYEALSDEYLRYAAEKEALGTYYNIKVDLWD